ncbi:MAG TPA: hypothetical protein VFF14_02305 [Candidatus Deferrimicrobium sp.]|nr:hypothetical protein [Candidatus Deferrimicrobium sp.]
MWAIRELETLLYKHPCVWDVAAIKENEEALAVYVQPRSGCNLAALEVIQFCRQQGTNNLPQHVHVVSKLPKTKTGKISRNELGQLKPISSGNFS